MGATMGSEQTAAAEGKVGTVRRDPMAMLPFLGYHVGDYLQHWLDIGAKAEPSKLPIIFYVNWFRRSADGAFLWPGFGDNARILKWALQRIEGTAEAVHTPIGDIPSLQSLDLDGLQADEQSIRAALEVDPAEWIREIESIDDWYATIGGNKLPDVLREELGQLKQRLAAARRDTGQHRHATP
jgi:phosphoenolpyruvate carboxykinase (GTP)